MYFVITFYMHIVQVKFRNVVIKMFRSTSFISAYVFLFASFRVTTYENIHHKLLGPHIEDMMGL